MSYEKQTWQTGDVVTSAKLNHMENGIAAGGALVVNVTYDEQTELYICDKTAGEIYAACPGVIFVSGSSEFMSVGQLYTYGFGDSGYSFSDTLGAEYVATVANDYPMSNGGK